MPHRKPAGSGTRSDRTRKGSRTTKGAVSKDEPRPFGIISITVASILIFAFVVAYGALQEGLFTKRASTARVAVEIGQDQPTQPLAEEEGAPSLSDSVRLLSDRLAADPGDLEGWVLLGHSYLVMGRYEEAVRSFGKARLLDPKNPDIQVSFGEALVLATGGRVTPDAQAAFKVALDANPAPGHPVARYYLALSAYQEGDQEKAVAMWRALLDQAPNDAPWREAVRQRLTEAGALPPSNTERAAAKGSADRSPPAAPLEAAPEIVDAPADEQAAMIQSMVEGLAARLEDEPGDIAGWRMLVRSYNVLGQPEEAKTRLRAAIDKERRGTPLRAELERLTVETYGTEALD